MSKIDELIEKLCPNGVKYKKLSDIVTFERGKGFKKDDKGTGNSPIIFYGELYTTYGNYIDEIVSFVDEKKVPNKIFVNKGDIVLPISSTSAEAQIGKASVVRVDNVILGSDAIVIHHNLDSSYLMYYINSKIFEYYKMKCVSGTTIKHLAPKEMMKIKIAVPPLELQHEIVNILDNFTILSEDLMQELSKELETRQKQYEYYKNKILSFEQNEKWVKLKDIVDFKNGKGHEKEIVKDGKYIVVNSKFISTNGEVKKYSNQQICPLVKDDILMVMSDLPNGRALAKCFLVTENEKYTLNQRIGCFHVKDNNLITTKFLLYVLNRNLQLLKYDNGVDQTNLRKDDILNINIPIPNMKQQEKITILLERFDKIYNELLEKIPTELEAEQKKYEYYRNKLLTFKELVNEG